jgi:GT2 family glycosyltransferase
MPTSTLDFIYVNYLSSVDILASVVSLRNALAGSNFECNVYIVDNSFSISGAESASALFSFANSQSAPSFRIVYLPSDVNLGFGRACNKAADLCQSDYLVFVNCDTSFEPSSVEGFHAALSSFADPSIAIVGPRVLSESGLLHASCFSFDPISILLKPSRHIRKIARPAIRALPQYRFLKKRVDRLTYEGQDLDSVHRVDWVSGCFMFVRSSFFDLAGGFDRRYFLYFEDVDLCRKARQVGLCVLYDPRLTVVHRASHGSARRRGILRSLFHNDLARQHVFSWLQYMYKWRLDFFKKISKFLMSKLYGVRRPKSSYGYSLDFSNFHPYDPQSVSPENFDTY